MKTKNKASFDDLSLSSEVIKGLNDVGYESPSPIQSLVIPHLMKGRDVIGQAQTGTGKTAAFALPILSKIDLQEQSPQVLVLAPTRELAIQVAEAFQKYAAHMPQFRVLPIYGGQDYSGQLRSLKRGVHVVVGTPGRVMDHIRRKTLKLDTLKTLVLDEADEMLRMGFIDDVEWILNLLPEKRQIALFSATMPAAVRRIAENYLVNPELIKVASKSSTADTVRQRCWLVKKVHKLDALTRILDAESYDATIIFVRTKLATLELAEKLKARGFAAEPLNGDIVQNQREKTVNLLKSGALDILIATDVAARGLDVERVSLVINYDIPFDPEAYVHRIGRTGRAGRKGDTILFASPREQRMLRTIEKATKNKIELMELPSKNDVIQKRKGEFLERLGTAVASEDLEIYAKLVLEFIEKTGTPLELVTAALAKLAQGDRPIVLDDFKVVETKDDNKPYRRNRNDRGDKRGGRRGEGRGGDRRRRSGGSSGSSRRGASSGGSRKPSPKKPFNSGSRPDKKRRRQGE